jgi:hypothetical protein
MTAKHKLLATLGAGALVTLALGMTLKAGRGQCPECGYQGDLSDCKHCGWRLCLRCWQAVTKCPNCERSNP